MEAGCASSRKCLKGVAHPYHSLGCCFPDILSADVMTAALLDNQAESAN